jgi:predicted nucleic acid-binding protein
MARVALDSNVLVYAELEPDTLKGQRAADIILRAARDGVIPVQGLGEFLRVVQRRAPAAFAGALKQIVLYRATFLTPPTTDDVMEAAGDLAAAHGLQLWDAVICAAAERNGAKALLTEDLQDGRLLQGMRILNPFNSANDASIDALFS